MPANDAKAFAYQHQEMTQERIEACIAACHGIEDPAATMAQCLEALRLARIHLYAHASNTPDGAFDKVCAAHELLSKLGK